ncbi:uncharacterized protein HMPREF1541_06866 [Cyphellophora europaea CBS 101466]|uniref:PIPK domain-containing protein n=1 Tax=Cyphellophora europaea (strain CBS 101466) TaxID=1220924 RepID=W2RQU0_CYPE1|nr:uncharacterized protein HMPREF1541_06866 [Cyphellophora europaea CBS 101466]ETN38827.1 hypothetical protein HMPREF1541_06866 [Cyphellophora europaea CBS 101466]
MARQDEISKSIVAAILTADRADKRGLLRRVLYFVSCFFTLFRIRLIRIRNEVFQRLRSTWSLDEDGYDHSFSGEEPLKATGDMGYSGSSFFHTSDGAFIVKSVPRRFEHSFFRDDLLDPYANYMTQNPTSLLIRITDFLGWPHVSLGGILGLVPNYHIVMENLLTGQDEAKASGGGDWETWDLKPTSYFFPERDIAGGRLTSEATKSKLADRFDDKIAITKDETDSLIRQLERDTTLLADNKAVDYSLFLIRIPLSQPQNPFADDPEVDNAPQPPDYPPFAPPAPPSWRTGIRSADGKYVFRAAVLDFFWAKHKVQPKLFTLLIRAWNLIDRQGPMSITTTPEEYRERFLQMCREIVNVTVDGESRVGVGYGTF